MIHLNNAPIFLEFLQKVFDSLQTRYYHKSIAKEFFIYSRCNCNQSDCATVILKRKTPWKNQPQSDTLDTPKGYVNINVLDDEFIEIECIHYKFAHKHEINRLFKDYAPFSKSYPKMKITPKKLKIKDRLWLQRYCNNKLSIYEKRIYDKLDYRATKGSKLFMHLR